MAKLRGIPACLFVLGILLFFSTCSYAVELCAYDGPDTSGHDIEVSDFSISASSSNLSIGDHIHVTFYLKNVGEEAVNLTDKGIYAAVRDKNGNNHDFGPYMKNQVLGVSERVKFEQSFEIDENGLWSVWPAYQIWITTYSPVLDEYITMKVSGPSEWHTCEAEACPDYCEDGVHYYDGYIGQDTECIYYEEECEGGCSEEGIACTEEDTEDPEVSITESPPEPTAVSNITFTVIATDNVDVGRIVIYVNGRDAFECEPPEYFERDEYWQCVWRAGRFPAGELRYKARAYDSAGNSGMSGEKTLDVAGLTPSVEHETIPETVPGEIRCSISGRISDFKYYSKTLAVKACEAQTIGGGCSPTPPYTCTQPMTSCRTGGQTYYDTNLTRIWAEEERFMSPGPMDYQIDVACNRSYLLQPVYQPYGEECQWKGDWAAEKGNFAPSTEPFAEGYDFSFEPMDLGGPSITEVRYLIENMDSMSQYLYHLSFARFVSVKAYDGSGIQSIKIWGNLTAVGFVSDEDGPLQDYLGPNRTMFYNTTQECNASSCNFTFTRPSSATPDFTGIESGIRVRVCDGAGNSVSATYNKTYAPSSGTGDLRIVSVEPVQVVYGAPLIKGKATAFRVKVDSSFQYPVEVKLRLVLPEGQWGVVSGTGNLVVGRAPDWEYQEVWGPIKIPEGASMHEIMVPIIPGWKEGENGTDSGQMLRGECIGDVCGPDARVMPTPIAENVGFSVEIDPGNELGEANESNNLLTSPYYKVNITRPMKIYYAIHAGGNMAGHEAVLGHLNGDYITCPASGKVFTVEEVCNEAKEFAKRTVEYMLGVAPVADNKVSYFVDCTVRDEASYSDYTGTMLALAQENNFDYMLSMEPCDCCGACVPGASGCGIGLQGQPTTGAHELLSHGISRFEEECYDCKPDACDVDSGGNLVNCTVACDACGASEGFWVNEWAAYGNGSKSPYRPPTYYADYVSTPDKVWQRVGGLWTYDRHDGLPGGYLTLIERFYDEEDPTVLLVRGQIYKNSSAEFGQFEVLENGTPNIEEGGAGDYYLVLLDSQQNVLGKAGFDASFYLMEAEGRKELDRASFVYRMEWKEGAKRIELRDGTGRVLASRQVSSNKPEVKMLYPNGGEVFAKGNKIGLKWEGSDNDNDALTYSLAISRDNGAWLPVSIDIQGSEYELDTAGLEEGGYLIRVRATDGVNTAEDVSDGPFGISISEAVGGGAKPEQPAATGMESAKGSELPVLLFAILAVFALMIVIGWLLLKRKG